LPEQARPLRHLREVFKIVIKRSPKRLFTKKPKIVSKTLNFAVKNFQSISQVQKILPEISVYDHLCHLSIGRFLDKDRLLLG